MRWAEQFDAATYSGASYGEGNIDDGELSPEDIILHEIRWRLAADTKLAAIFGSAGIEVVDFRTPVDIRDLPRLQLYGGDTGETKFPYQAQDYAIRVELAARWDPGTLGPVAPGFGTVWSMWHRVKRVLKANQMLVTNQAPDIQLAKRSEQAGAISAPFVEDIGGDGSRPVCAQILPWNFIVLVDYLTGRLINIQAAG